MTQTPESARAAQALARRQGESHVWLAGHSVATPGNWHEGAFVSGLVVAQALGGEYPFRKGSWAENLFNVIRNDLLP